MTEKRYPDLSGYDAGIYLKGITVRETEKMLSEYGGLYTDSPEIRYSVTEIPGTDWVRLGLDCAGDSGFRDYNNILIWMSGRASEQFALALPPRSDMPMFFAVVDRENPFGDACVGIYDDWDLYFTVPEESIEWGPECGTPFDHGAYLRRTFGFDIKWITENK